MKIFNNLRDYDTLQDLRRAAVQAYGPSTWFLSDSDGGEISFADANLLIERTAAALTAGNLAPGARIAVWSAFREEAPILFHAAVSAGFVFVPVDPDLSASAMKRIVENVGASLLFVDAELLEAARAAVSLPLIRFDAATPDEDAASAVVTFGEWVAAAPEQAPQWDAPAAESPAAILHTSGTTDTPKGVVLSHRALTLSGLLAAKTFGWSSSDTLLSLGDLHAMSGLRNPCIASLAAGAKTVVPADAMRGNLLAIPETLARRRCTVLAAAPAFLRGAIAFGNRMNHRGLSSLRHIVCTGSELSPDTRTRFVADFGVPVLNYYGLTETGGLCVAETDPTAPPSNGSLGVPVGCEISIVDEEGIPVAQGETGELLIRSPQLMSGYWNRPDLTAEVLREGTLHTGDLVRQAPDGRIYLLGRKRDIIKDAAGNLIYLAEVERALCAHPSVREAGVVGFVSPHGDERLAAFVLAASESQDERALFEALRRHISETLGRRLVPDRFILRDTLPRDNLGSLKRAVLKKEL